MLDVRLTGNQSPIFAITSANCEVKLRDYETRNFSSSAMGSLNEESGEKLCSKKGCEEKPSKKALVLHKLALCQTCRTQVLCTVLMVIPYKPKFSRNWQISSCLLGPHISDFQLSLWCWPLLIFLLFLWVQLCIWDVCYILYSTPSCFIIEFSDPNFNVPGNVSISIFL